MSTARKIRHADPEQPSLFSYDNRKRYPETPGYKAEGTSEQAARSMRSRAQGLRDRALAEIARAAGTSDEIAARLGESILSVRPRVAELAKDDPARGIVALIEPTGVRRPNASGTMATVWRVKKSDRAEQSR